MKRLICGALAALVLATPASAVNTYRPTDSSGLVSPEPLDDSAGLGSEDNPDLAGAMPGRRPTSFFSGRGWQQGCSAKFSVQENTLQNTTFASPWAGTSTGGPAVPTLVANNAQAPDGTMTAATLTIPAVTAANSFSLFSEVFNGINATENLTAVVYANNPAGNAPVWFVQNSFFASTGHYVTQVIPGDGAWHKAVVQLPGFGTSGNLGFSVGVDLRDVNESASAGTKTVRIWHPSLWLGAHGEVYNFIPTTTGGVTQTQTIPCPTGIAFRNYAPLTPWATPPVQPNSLFPPTGAFLTWNTSNTYEAGGGSNPIITSTVTVSGVTYGWAATTSAGNTDYQSLVLYQSTSPGNWTEVPSGSISGGQPVFTTNGGTFNKFLLHGWFGKCSTATFCTYFSAAPSTNAANSAIFLSTASNVLGPWSTPTIVIAGSVVDDVGASNPSLPTIVDDGVTQHMYVSKTTNGLGQTRTNYFTSPHTDGLTWTWRSIGLPPPISGNWDAARTGIQDSDVFQNSCGPNGKGFYEYYYTINSTFQGFYQQIGVAISPWPTGPWWTSPASIFPLFPQLALTTWYAGRGQTDALLGTSAVAVNNGTFYYTASATLGNASALPNGVAVQATMPDACANYRAN